MDLDDVLDDLGHFGRFQIRSYGLISLPILFSAIFALSYVFTAGELQHRCRIPECEGTDGEFYPTWLGSAVPYQNSIPSSCLRYESRNGTFSSNNTCLTNSFDNSSQIRCHEWIYQNEERTIMSEFDLTCEENQWKITLVGTVNNIGQFFGMPIAGYISDRMGRRKTLVLAVVLASIMGIIRSLAWSYESFLAFEFLDPLCGSGLYTAGIVLGTELVGPSARVFGNTIISVFYTCGEIILGSVSLWLQNWRWILRVVYIPALLCISYYWIAPESIRWLLAKGRSKEAYDNIMVMAKTNKVVVTEEMMKKINSLVEQKKDVKEEITASRKSAVLQIFLSKILLLRLLTFAFCWFTITFVFFGLSLNSVSVGGNKYTNFILVALVEIPAYLVYYQSMDRLGRKLSLCGSLLVSGLSCIVFPFLPPHMDWLRLLFFLLGKFGITISFAVVFLFTAELFPTELRHSILGWCCMLGRIGSIIAPQTPLLEKYVKSLPVFLFGGMSVVSGILAFSFPETLNTKLPDTIEEAENIGKTVKV